MKKKEFEKGYIERSNISKEFYDKNFVTLPCNCGDKLCDGWACVSNNEFEIKTHNDLYAN
jgi:hypothetical protein